MKKIDNNFKIRNYKRDDIQDVFLLVSKTFKKYNFKEGTRVGVRDYINFYKHYKKNKDEILKSFKKTNIFLVLVNSSNNEIIGMIRGKKNRITNLFVNGEYHGKGYGKMLIKKFEKIAKKEKSKEINIRSSLHGVKFYEKMGYKIIAPITTMHGIYVRPMIKKFRY